MTTPAPRHRQPVRVQTPRRAWRVPVIGAAVVALIAGLFIAVRGTDSTGSSTSSGASSTGTPLLAPVDGAAAGATVDGIQCAPTEQVLFHIHAHLAVFVGGSQRGVPAGIGIAPPRQISDTDSGPFVGGGSCFYWLHSHTADGIIHIESPVQRSFTLGDYFDIWGQPLDATHVGPAQGTVIAYVDGRRVSGSPRGIVLGAHTLVQLDVGTDVPPQGFDFPSGL